MDQSDLFMSKVKLGLLRLATVARVVISEQNSSTSSLLLYPNLDIMYPNLDFLSKNQCLLVEDFLKNDIRPHSH